MPTYVHFFDNLSWSCCFVLAITCTDKNLIIEHTYTHQLDFLKKLKKNPTNRGTPKGLETSVLEYSTRRIQIFQVYFCSDVIWKVNLWKEVKNGWHKTGPSRFEFSSSPRAFRTYSLFALKQSFTSGSKIYPSKPPRMDLKSGPRHENGTPYGARESFVLLRPTNKIKLLTQSAQIYMGKWAFPNGAVLFLRLQKGLRLLDFFRGSICYQCRPLKNIKQEISTRDEEIKWTLSQKITIFGKITRIRPWTLSFGPVQTSIASPILVRWQQMMARWNRLTKGKSFLAIWQGSGTITKISICWWQTDSSLGFVVALAVPWQINFHLRLLGEQSSCSFIK